MQFKEWFENKQIKTEAFFDYLKPSRNLVPTPIYKNPTSKELNNRYNEVRMYIIGEDVYSWQSTELLHGEVARMLNFDNKRIPLIAGLYHNKILNAFVTDDSKHTIWHENGKVVNAILSNKNFMTITTPDFNSKHIEFYNQDIVGDWKELTLAK
jgi:hypothetical protein